MKKEIVEYDDMDVLFIALSGDENEVDFDDLIGEDEDGRKDEESS